MLAAGVLFGLPLAGCTGPSADQQRSVKVLNAALTGSTQAQTKLMSMHAQGGSGVTFEGQVANPTGAGSAQVSGSLLINKGENTAMLICWGLPPLPADQTYQAWLVQPDGVRVSAA